MPNGAVAAFAAEAMLHSTPSWRRAPPPAVCATDHASPRAAAAVPHAPAMTAARPGRARSMRTTPPSSTGSRSHRPARNIGQYCTRCFSCSSGSASARATGARSAPAITGTRGSRAVARVSAAARAKAARNHGKPVGLSSSAAMPPVRKAREHQFEQHGPCRKRHEQRYDAAAQRLPPRLVHQPVREQPGEEEEQRHPRRAHRGVDGGRHRGGDACDGHVVEHHGDDGQTLGDVDPVDARPPPGRGHFGGGHGGLLHGPVRTGRARFCCRGPPREPRDRFPGMARAPAGSPAGARAPRRHRLRQRRARAPACVRSTT